MIQLVKPADVEFAIATDLGIACAPVPSNLGDNLPYSVVTRTGGGRSSFVVDRHYIDIDTWAETPGEAFEASSSLMAEALNLAQVGGSCIYEDVQADIMPRQMPDPLRPDLARYSFALIVTTRGIVQ